MNKNFYIKIIKNEQINKHLFQLEKDLLSVKKRKMCLTMFFFLFFQIVSFNVIYFIYVLHITLILFITFVNIFIKNCFICDFPHKFQRSYNFTKTLDKIVIKIAIQRKLQ